jgi:uncharacterized protein (DUF2147 family)
MSKMLRTILSAGAVALMGLAPAAAFADQQLGVYQTTDRKMDYELRLCGNGKQLCVKLAAARGTAATPQTTPYIGKDVVTTANPSGKNKWKGKMQVAQYKLDGTLTLNPGTNFVMSGCVYVVVCQDFTLIPAK